MSWALVLEAFEKVDAPDGASRQDLIDVFAVLGRIEAWATAAVGSFDADEQYAADGAATMRAWIEANCRQSSADAARSTSMARKLRSLPHTMQAWRDGGIGTGHARAICANVPNRYVEKFAEVEASMVSAFGSLSVHDTTVVMQKWAEAAKDADPQPDPDEPADTLHVSETLDGRRVIKGHLSTDNAIELEQALAHAMTDDHETPLSQRNAEALVELARFFNNHNTKAGARRNRPQLTILVKADDDGAPVAHTLGGTPVSRSKLQTWLCDGAVSRMMTSGSHILDYGHSISTVPVPLWRAVATRDQCCRFGECHRDMKFCEAHHVIPFEQGGDTVISNLVLLCAKHHHFLHKEDGWSVVLEPDGTLHITAPDGTVRTTHPPGLRDTLWPPGEAAG